MEENNRVSVKEKLLTKNYLAIFVSNLLMFFSFYLLLPILPLYLAEEFSASKSVIGLILASYTITALLIRPLGGCWVDRYPRKLFLLITYISFVACFGGYLVAGVLVVFGILRALHGVTFGLVTISSSTMVTDIIPVSRRSEGIGYFALSTNIAMSLGPVVAMLIYEKTHRCELAFWVSFVAGILGIVSLSMIKGVKQDIQPKRKVKLSLGTMFLVNAWPCALVLSFIAFGYGVLITYVAVYGIEVVGLKTGVGMFFVVMAMGLVLSRIISAPLMNRKKLTLSALIGMSLMLVGYVIFILWKREEGFFLSAGLLGVSYGFVCPAFQVMFIDMGRNDQRGVANSTYFISWDLGIGIGVLIGGQVASSLGYSWTYGLALILSGVGLILFKVYGAPYFQKNKLM